MSPITPSSQFSVPSTIPSPQIVTQTFVDALLFELEHCHPNSVKQLKQPSPDTVLPSSHCSETVMYVSPHVSEQTSELNQVPPEQE